MYTGKNGWTATATRRWEYRRPARLQTFVRVGVGVDQDNCVRLFKIWIQLGTCGD